MKKYNIKTTDVELLKKWYYLMTLGRALDEKAPAYLLQSLGWAFPPPYAGPCMKSIYQRRRFPFSLLP